MLANRDDRFDLTIVDLDLPRWDIIERIQILHDSSVLALTNVQNLKRCTRAWRARANEVLSMASSEKKIVRMVNRLVSDQRFDLFEKVWLNVPNGLWVPRPLLLSCSGRC